MPDVAQHAADYLLDRYHEAHARHSALVIGVFRETKNGDLFNSILTLGENIDWYDKMHLVPFTEAIPGPAFAHQWLEFMNLPFEGFTYGAAHQPPVRGRRPGAAAGHLLRRCVRQFESGHAARGQCTCDGDE